MRSFTLSIVIAFMAGTALAIFTQGTIDDQRDYMIYYNKDSYPGPDATVFCTAFYQACVAYNGPINRHHSIDCVVAQTTPAIYAACGGRLKNAEGKVRNSEKNVDATFFAIAGLNATIVGLPQVPLPMTM